MHSLNRLELYYDVYPKLIFKPFLRLWLAAGHLTDLSKSRSKAKSRKSSNRIHIVLCDVLKCRYFPVLD